MPTDFEQYCDTIEEGYEFTLSYAAQGHLTDRSSAQGHDLREHLTRSANAMRNLKSSCAAAVKAGQLESAARYEAFLSVLARDAEDSVAAIELVLAQPSISSQLIDNLNASIHLRALLTDIFLLAEILETHSAARLNESQHEVI